MTEQEWLARTDWRELFDFIEGKVSDRKLRLFAVACCKTAWLLLGEDSRKAVEIAENFADGLATGKELQAVRKLFLATESDQVVDIWHGRRYRHDFGGHVADENASWAARSALRESADLVAWHAIKAEKGSDFTDVEFSATLYAEMKARRRLLHDVVGPLPFQSGCVDPHLATDTLIAAAETIYQERRFADMPSLADALEEAGCIDTTILAHCRQQQEHVRGCWVVDLILGRK